MKRVAFPVDSGKLSLYFGQCEYYKIFILDHGMIISDVTIVPPNIDLLSMPKWVAEQKINDLITHKIDKTIMSIFQEMQINLFVGVEMLGIKELIENYMSGKIRSDDQIINELLNSK